MEDKKITKESIYTGFTVLLKYLGQYKKQVVVLSILGIFSAIGNGTVPYIIGRFFDAILDPATVSLFGFTVALYAVAILIWALVQLITTFIDWRINRLSEYLSNTIWIDYIAQSFSFILLLPLSFHKKNKIGEIGHKINMAGNALETIIGRIGVELAPHILSIVIAIAIGFYINWILALVLILGVLIYIITLSRSVKDLGALHKDYHQTVSKSFGDAYDAIGNTHTIKQAAAEDYESNRVSSSLRSSVPKWMRFQMIWSNLTLYQRMTILATQLVIFFISIGNIQNGTMTLGELLAFNAYSAMVFGPFVTIAQNWQTIQNGLINIEETEKILRTRTEIYSPENGIVINSLRGNVTLTDVAFSYEEGKDVLSGMSFDVKEGEVIALVGESGVGKSTLVDLISGYNFPTKGSVLIDGNDIKIVNLKSLRSQIAVVPQEVVLFNDTIKTNIKYGNFEATDVEVEEAARKAHALDFINTFPEKWEQVVGERGVKLSVGQKQRVAIARAILRNPKILILDEPTSALDAGSEKIITESLEELMKGKTTFIIAHRLSTVRKADKILVFKGGTIIESGTHAELLKKEGGEYKRLYQLQIGLHD